MSTPDRSDYYDQAARRRAAYDRLIARPATPVQRGRIVWACISNDGWEADTIPQAELRDDGLAWFRSTIIDTAGEVALIVPHAPIKNADGSPWRHWLHTSVIDIEQPSQQRSAVRIDARFTP